ncbi:MAG: YdeI/OmpD-associated family protein [Pseudomonadota bacterium]|nr:YdeI/OmpD-associated family protein [Pseudomonadota bacterium]
MTEIFRTFDWTVPAGSGMAHIPVPFDQRAVFGKARPPVVVAINGYAYRSTISVMAGEAWVPLRKSHREAAAVAHGQTVEVTLTLDTAPRTIALAADVAATIDAAGLRAAWDKLSYTNQREHAEAIDTAKRAATRETRIAALITRLAELP